MKMNFGIFPPIFLFHIPSADKPHNFHQRIFHKKWQKLGSDLIDEAQRKWKRRCGVLLLKVCIFCTLTADMWGYCSNNLHRILCPLMNRKTSPKSHGYLSCRRNIGVKNSDGRNRWTPIPMCMMQMPPKCRKWFEEKTLPDKLSTYLSNLGNWGICTLLLLPHFSLLFIQIT